MRYVLYCPDIIDKGTEAWGYKVTCQSHSSREVIGKWRSHSQIQTVWLLFTIPLCSLSEALQYLDNHIPSLKVRPFLGVWHLDTSGRTAENAFCLQIGRFSKRSQHRSPCHVNALRSFRARSKPNACQTSHPIQVVHLSISIICLVIIL